MSLNKAAAILYSSLHQPEEAMAILEQSLRIFQESDIQRDSSNITAEMVRNRLQLVRQEVQGYEPEERALLALRQQGCEHHHSRPVARWRLSSEAGLSWRLRYCPWRCGNRLFERVPPGLMMRRALILRHRVPGRG